MILAGSGGHTRELYDIISGDVKEAALFTFEEVETSDSTKFAPNIQKLIGYEALKQQITKDPHFALAVGNPSLREKFYTLFTEAGGIAESVFAGSAQISRVHVELGAALNVMHFVFISNNVKIGTGVLLNTGCRIHHDCTIGDFSEISPNVTLTGNCTIGKKCAIGSSATILPGIIIGDNVIVGAGSVVTKNIEANSVVAGVPAKPIRKK